MSETTQQQLEKLFQCFGLSADESRIAADLNGGNHNDPVRTRGVTREELDIFDSY
jgi:hypothetical protein